MLAERAVERFVRAERAARHADDGRDAGAHANIHRACARAQRVRVQALVCGRGGAGLSRARSSYRCSGEVSRLETQKSAVQCLWVAEPPINEPSWLAQVAGIRSLALSRAAARWGGWAWPRWADAALRTAPVTYIGCTFRVDQETARKTLHKTLHRPCAPAGPHAKTQKSFIRKYVSLSGSG